MQHTAHSHPATDSGRLPLGRQAFAHPVKNLHALGVEPGMSVADFGSGSGAYVMAIAENMGNAGHIYAVDVQRELLRRIKNEAEKRGYKNVGVIWADLEQPRASKMADKSLDRVLLSNLLFQVSDKTAVLQEAFRVLRSIGRLIIIDWSDSFGGMGPLKKDVVTKEEALALAQAAGFELVKEFSAGAHHYGLICKPVTPHA